MHRPRAVLFDALDTLFSTESLRPRLMEVGLEPQTLELWLAETLRDGFALGAAGVFRSFKEVATGALEVLLERAGKPIDPELVGYVVSGFGELRAHPDAAPALARLAAAKVPVAVVTNGGPEATRMLLRKERLERYVQHIVSMEDVHRWKPRPEVYLKAVMTTEAPRSTLALVTCHAWDLLGAQEAGLFTCWIERRGTWSKALARPDLAAGQLEEVVEALMALPE